MRTSALTLKDALGHIGGLSAPDKMPCHSWSIPARYCVLGSKLAASVPDSACAHCYALKGFYVMPCVEAAMERRHGILMRALADPLASVGFVEAFSHVLNRKAENTRERLGRGQTVRRDGRYFRWHDSGDLQGATHLDVVARICDQTPRVHHWLPTREAGFVAELLEARPLPCNLTVRLSAPRMDVAPAGRLLELERHPRIVLSGVHSTHEPTGYANCGAERQGGHCRDCRACWESDDRISYHLH